ncbi:MAG: hypothetical protein ACJAS9_001996 [Polaribacter sp.]|jgi:hypothetical protein
MQLINKHNSLKNSANDSKRISLKSKLAIAATGLLSATATETIANEATDEGWYFSASVLAYSETDRVSAVEVIFNAETTIDETGKLNIKFVLDSLTGASANGAITQNTLQTFSRPSGNGQYNIAAGTTPLDDTFKDTRAQLNLSWSNLLSPESDYQYTLGTNISKEYDFQSISLSAELAKGFNQKNTTISGGFSVAAEKYNPKGSTPIGLTSMAIRDNYPTEDVYDLAFDATRGSTSEAINSAELLLGWTQVVNRSTLMQFNYGYADKSGYLTDPFKIVSVVNASGITQDYIYENRPESRTQHSLFGLVKKHLNESIIDFSYRFTSDDWEIDTHTLDLHWKLFADGGSFWEPHVRFYQQSAADFYSTYLDQSEEVPPFISADYRIGEMSSITLGLKYGFEVNKDQRAEVRLEYYRQTPKSVGTERVAGLENLDLYPELDAVYLQVNYYF